MDMFDYRLNNYKSMIVNQKAEGIPGNDKIIADEESIIADEKSEEESFNVEYHAKSEENY